MDFLISVLLGVLITAVAYLLVPVILSVCVREFTSSQIRKIVIINGFCVWLIFTIIRIENGMVGNTAAVFLWSAVAYWLMNRQIAPKFATIALSILLVISIGCNIGQFYQAASTKFSQVPSTDNTGHTEYILPDDYYEVKEKAEFYDKTIVFVVEGYGDYYFTYNQMMQVTANDESFTYWAYNKEQAISLGYTEYQH